MPNKKTHVCAGAITGTAATLAMQVYDQNLNVLETIGAITGGILGGRLPDLIDPPVSPLHRSIGHSPVLAVLASASAVAGIIWLREEVAALKSEANRCTEYGYSTPSHITMKFIIYSLLIGFLVGTSTGLLSHLALDSRTPAGIKL